MKQKYTKPVLLMETFTLSQNIAHNCGKNLDLGKATLNARGVCGWDLGFDGGHGTGSDILFMVGQSVCTFPTEYFAGVCYNNPEGGYNIFNS